MITTKRYRLASRGALVEARAITILLVIVASSAFGISPSNCGNTITGSVERRATNCEVTNNRSDNSTSTSPGARSVAERRVLYSTDQIHSPIDGQLAERLRSIAEVAAQRENVFAKGGDSILASDANLNCFSGNNIQLRPSDNHLAATLKHFLAGDTAGSNPFGRDSDFATCCVKSDWGLQHAADEIDTISPRYAVFMFGTNDVRVEEGLDLREYAVNMLGITDFFIDRGVIPILMSIPVRLDSRPQIPRYNLMVRAIAQGRQVPFVDFNLATRTLPDHGLYDGIHPSVLNDEESDACVFTGKGLMYGYNVLNLLILEALHRARLAREVAFGPDANTPVISGNGTHTDPFVIDRLPFTDMRDTRITKQRWIKHYGACDNDSVTTGAEYYYRLDLDVPTQVRLIPVSSPPASIRVYVLRDKPVGGACIQVTSRKATVSLDVGTWFFSVDTGVDADGVEQAGEYMFVIDQPE